MEKLDKQIIVGLQKDQAAISVSPDMTAAEAFQLTGTLALHLMKAYLEIASRQIESDSKAKTSDKKAAIKGIKDSIYDAMNNVFSNVLASFDPDSPRQTIEEEAIIELVNAKIDEQYNALSNEEKSSYAQAYNKLKLNLEYRANEKNPFVPHNQHNNNNNNEVNHDTARRDKEE